MSTKEKQQDIQGEMSSMESNNTINNQEAEMKTTKEESAMKTETKEENENSVVVTPEVKPEKLEVPGTMTKEENKETISNNKVATEENAATKLTAEKSELEVEPSAEVNAVAEQNDPKDAMPVFSAKEDLRPEGTASISQELLSDEARAEQVCALINQHLIEPQRAYEAADKAFCEARQKCGSDLFRIMFNDDTSRIGPNIFRPVYPVSYKLLMSMRDFPLKNKTGVKNLVYLGYQRVWLKERDFDVDKLITEQKVTYTSLVRIASMPYDDRKLELMGIIARREIPFTVSEIEDEIRNLLKKKVPFPPNFEDVFLLTSWMPQVVQEKIVEVTEGIDITEETTQKVLDGLFRDLNKIAEQKSVLKGRKDQLADTLRKTRDKAMNYLKCINDVLRHIEKKEKTEEKAAA